MLRFNGSALAGNAKSPMRNFPQLSNPRTPPSLITDLRLNRAENFRHLKRIKKSIPPYYSFIVAVAKVSHHRFTEAVISVVEK